MYYFWNERTKAVSNTGPRFNIKMTSYQYRKSHCGDKTVVRPSYLHNGISYTGKIASLYWISALSLSSTNYKGVKLLGYTYYSIYKIRRI